MADFTTNKVTGSQLTAAEWNQLADVDNFTSSTSQTPSTGDLNQLGKAAAVYAGQGGIYCTDSGAADAYVLTQISPLNAPPVATLKVGTTIVFRPGADNTGACTANAFSHGVKNIKTEDGSTDPSPGDLSTTRDVKLIWDGTVWRISGRNEQTLSGTNLIINGQGLIATRGTTFDSTTNPANNDDTYLLDRMLLLSDGNDIVDVSQETTTVPSGAYSCIKFDQETANKQWAYCQILEAKDAAKVIGGVASFSFKARKGGSNATLETLRAAVISWDSTEDVVTSDVIGTWAGAGTDPTLATNWTYENTPTSLTLTTSFQTFKIENVAIDTSGTKNVAVLIWLDDTDATVADTAFIGDIQLESGRASTPYQEKLYIEEDIACKRFLRPITNVQGASSSTTTFQATVKWDYPMRVTPTLSQTAVATVIQYIGGSSTQSSTSLTFLNPSNTGGRIVWNNFSGLTSKDPASISGVAGYADSEL